MSDIIISDEEWGRFLKDEYKNVLSCLPTKDITEKFFNWRLKDIKAKLSDAPEQ